MKISTGTLVVLGVIILGTAVAGSGLWGRHLAQTGPLQQEARVHIEPGKGPRSIASSLEKAGVISSAETFVMAVRIMDLDSTLKAGEYAFEPGISLRAVINKLALGDTENRTVTIPEGWTVKEIMAKLEATEGLTGKATSHAEGMLFPDTYAFRFGTERGKIMDTMHTRMEQELQTAWNTRSTALPLKTPDELLTLASIVQKEAANDAEMPQIASVFVNRLVKGMRLQSDPTVIYGAEDYKGDIRRKDLQDQNPFNTYTNAGLPPTPIASPGKAALLATANPASGNALYFVSLPDRSGHVFSSTYEEHQRHVKTYWQNVNKVSPTSK